MDGYSCWMSFGSFGFGGKGMFESRPHDQFGWGFYYINIDNPAVRGPVRTIKLLRDEYGFEAFYNIAITPWLQLTPDIQIVRGAQKDKITLGTLPAPIGLPFIRSKKSIDTSTILGLRLRMVF